MWTKLVSTRRLLEGLRKWATANFVVILFGVRRLETFQGERRLPASTSSYRFRAVCLCSWLCPFCTADDAAVSMFNNALHFVGCISTLCLLSSRIEPPQRRRLLSGKESTFASWWRAGRPARGFQANLQITAGSDSDHARREAGHGPVLEFATSLCSYVTWRSALLARVTCSTSSTAESTLWTMPAALRVDWGTEIV